ncbi:MAG: cysteine--tRNA ligase, partial [Deltaproteobacteria bacterium]|nr:cysteine--tRNA ligase [Deltaproteobacteria bacterium]
MSLYLHNTLKNKKEEFIPVEEGRVKLYVCGPTVYDDSHIGHARAVLVFDLLVRHLRASGYQVLYVRNFTDLDDKIINRSQAEGIHFLDLANRYIKSFHEDMDALNAFRPDIEPRATEYIQLMIADIQGILDAGYAYQIDGDVYYDVTHLSSYGCLSGRNIEDLQAGARVEVDERKRHPLDFALWKKSKPGEPSWPCPWGEGRPGWHIECSSMSNHLLGQEFDIHGGGHDLIFPHHENEMAQSKALGRRFARYWLHNGFVRVNHEKMSKSLKNFFTVREVLNRFRPEVLRLFLLSKHYRSPIDFSDEGLSETYRSLERAYRALQAANEAILEKQSVDSEPEVEAVLKAFHEAMDDDLNTAKALGYIFDAVRELNRLLDETEAGASKAEQ